MTNPDAIAAGYVFIWVLGAACLIKLAYWLTRERPAEQEDHDGEV